MPVGARPFLLTSSDTPWWLRGIGHLAERALGLQRLQQVHDAIEQQVGPGHTDPGPWLEAAMNWLGLDLDLPEGDLERIPASGACIVAAEHPTGAMEGILMLALLRRRRPDVKLLANQFLARIPALQDLVIPIDVFTNGSQQNGRAMRQTFRHLANGGVLLVFPAGEVAGRALLRKGKAKERPWQPTVAGLQRRTGAPVVPVHVSADNPAWFHAAGALHARLRTATLGHALLAQVGRAVGVRVGHAIRADQTARFAEDDRARCDYLRLRTEILARRRDLRPPTRTQVQAHTDVAARGCVDALASEIAALPVAAKLLTGNGMDVFCVRASEAPQVLAEIGRLREVTFRNVGEGSGNAHDLDRFDASYRHLFVWDPAAREIVGAYRLGLTDELLAAGGPAAIYTSEFYDYDARLWERLSPALELGRSFVQPRYQKSFAPLLLLWRGIGTFVAQNPRYRQLFGTVSISADHHATSVRLMVDHLRQHCLHEELAGHVRSRAPFAPAAAHDTLRWEPQQIADLQDVSAMVRELEVGRAGVPVLMEQYLKLGAKLLGVNVDPAFHTVDALVVVDLMAAPNHLLLRYLGPAGVATLQAAHATVASA